MVVNLGNALGNFNVKFAITKDNVETSNSYYWLIYIILNYTL